MSLDLVVHLQNQDHEDHLRDRDQAALPNLIRHPTLATKINIRLFSTTTIIPENLRATPLPIMISITTIRHAHFMSPFST